MQNFDEYKINRKKRLMQLQVTLSADYDEDVIENLYAFGQNAAAVHSSELEKRAQNIMVDEELNDEEKQMLFAPLSDEKNLNQDTVDLVSELQIIALSKSVEISVKNMLKYYIKLYPSNKVKIEEIYRFNGLTEAIQTTLGVDIKSLKGFAAYHELRLINNCIKHSGLVDDKLANYSGWVEGAKLSNLHSSYQRLKHDVRAFTFDLKDKFLSKV